MRLINKLFPSLFLLLSSSVSLHKDHPSFVLEILHTMCTAIIDVNENCNLDKRTYRTAIVIESYVYSYIRAIRLRYFSLYFVYKYLYFYFISLFFLLLGDILQVRPYQNLFSSENRPGAAFTFRFYFTLYTNYLSTSRAVQNALSNDTAIWLENICIIYFPLTMYKG